MPSEQYKRWYAANRDLVLEKMRMRYLAKRGGRLSRRSAAAAHRLSDEDRQKILDRYATGGTAGVIAIETGFSRDFIARLLRKSGISLRPNLSHKLTAKQKAKVISDYLKGLTTYQVGAKHSLDPSSVWAILRRRKLTRGVSESKRSCDFDEAAFDVISEASAYWAGMLMTDGCVSDTDGSTARVMLALQWRDRAHVSEFRCFLGSSHKLHILRPKFPGKKGGKRTQVRISVRSKKLADAVARFGIVPRKTHVAEVRVLDFDKHFWRGCLDGDGSVFLSKAPKMTLGVTPVVSICGASRRLLEQFTEFAHGICPEWTGEVSLKHRSVYSVRLQGRYAIQFIRALYGDCSIALARKLKTARRIIAIADGDPKWCHRLRESNEIAAERRAAKGLPPKKRNRQLLLY